MWIEGLLVLLLVGPYLVSKGYDRLGGRQRDRATMGLVGVTLLFGFTGVGHFLITDQMSRMFPEWVPQKELLIYLTGVIEIAAALAILVPRLRWFVGWGLVMMLVSFTPVNIYAALYRAPIGGHEFGPVYLLARLPMQLLFIGWIWWFALRGPAVAV